MDYRKAFENLSELRLCIVFVNKIIANANFTNIEREVFQNSRLGYSIHHEYQKQGLIKELVNCGLNLVFNLIKLHRVEANYIPDNIASEKVLETNGFQKIGISKAYLKINDTWADHQLSAITREDYLTSLF